MTGQVKDRLRIGSASFRVRPEGRGFSDRTKSVNSAGSVTWEAELRYHGEFGAEAQILRQGELVIGRRFGTRALAVQWDEEERKAISNTVGRDD